MRAEFGLALLLLSLSPSLANAWCQLRGGEDSSMGGSCEVEGELLAWRRACIGYSVDTTEMAGIAPETLRAVTARAFARWTELECAGSAFPLVIQEEAPRNCSLAQYDPDGPNVNTVTFVSDWPDSYDPSAFAVTTVFHDPETGEIKDADIILQTAQQPWAECPPSGCLEDDEGVIAVDLENTLTHEIGHFFGLAHSQMDFATMHAFAARGETDKRTVSSDDILGICSIYPDEAPSCEPADFVPEGGLVDECRPLPAGGCSVTTSSGGGNGVPLLVGLALVWRRRVRARLPRS